MALSVFDLFSIGIGPSSSHTVGPMRAAGTFLRELRDDGLLRRVTRVTADLYGSLGATGRGHGTDSAVLMGFAGELPETVDPRLAHQLLEEVGDTGRLALLGEHEVSLDAASDVVLHLGRSLPLHPNGMTFTAWSGAEQLAQHTYYSVGGGFISSLCLVVSLFWNFIPELSGFFLIVSILFFTVSTPCAMFVKLTRSK